MNNGCKIKHAFMQLRFVLVKVLFYRAKVKFIYIGIRIAAFLLGKMQRISVKNEG